jgi:hypothetical protein
LPAHEPGSSPLPQPNRPNQRVHIDIFGPLKAQDGTKKNILVMTDAFTKIVRLVIIQGKSAITVANAIRDQWISIFSAPEQIHSDQGLEFCNSLQQALCDAFKIKHTTTTPYFPACNGQVEIFNKTMAKYLRTMLAQDGKDWVGWELMIAPLMISFNSAVNKSTRVTPFYATFGYNPKNPCWTDGEVLDHTVWDKKADQPVLTEQQIRHRHEQAWDVVEHNGQLARSAATKTPDPTKNVPFQVGQEVWVTVTKNPKAINQKILPRWEKATIAGRPHGNAYKIHRQAGKGRKANRTINMKYIREANPTPGTDQGESNTPNPGSVNNNLDENEPDLERNESDTDDGENQLHEINPEEDEPQWEELQTEVALIAAELESWVSRQDGWTSETLRQLADMQRANPNLGTVYDIGFCQAQLPRQEPAQPGPPAGQGAIAAARDATTRVFSRARQLRTTKYREIRNKAKQIGSALQTIKTKTASPGGFFTKKALGLADTARQRYPTRQSGTNPGPGLDGRVQAGKASPGQLIQSLKRSLTLKKGKRRKPEEYGEE